MSLFSSFRNRSGRPDPRKTRIRPALESLEDRRVPSAVTTVFVETNSPIADDNAVLAFRRDADGGLHEIGKFATGGTGQVNLPKVIGPDDSSQEVVASSDGRFLFAVNQGSNSVTAFRIDRDGRLDKVGTFDSGGVQPDSIGISGNHLFVSNRGDSAAGHPGTVAPNVTAFTIGEDGSLTPVPNSTVSFPVDTSPSQNLISRDGRFLFADIFAVPGSTAAQGNTFAPFQIQADGTLKLAPGGNVGAPVTPSLLLGSAVHPKLNIVYAGLTGANQVGVFTYDETGKLSFVGDAPDKGLAACWVEVSADGKFLYEASTGSNTVGVFSLADPLHPVEIQSFTLTGPQAPAGSPAGTRETADFQLALDPSGRFLYVINQNTDPKGLFPQGNQLHVLDVGRDGTVSEPKGPHVFSQAEVPSVAHPQGIAVVRTEGERDDDRDRGDQGRDDRSRGDSSGADAAVRSRSSFSAAIDNVLDLLLQEKRDKKGGR